MAAHPLAGAGRQLPLGPGVGGGPNQMPAGKHTQWADDVRTPESRSPVASGKSFTSKHGKGFFMADLVNAAHRVAGLDHTSVAYIPGYAEENVHRLITTLLEYDQ
ncbi:hypothetical protein HaLaN_25735, partial [Haematococcus lacustris]